MRSDGDGGFGAYIHWPFCRVKCPYCDFNSHVRESIDPAQWKTALLTELDWFADRIGRRPLDSIFFGGGTPSLMPPDIVGAVIERLDQRFTFASDIEMTLEANPTSVEAEKFRAFQTAGVNRVSIGLQSLRDHSLRFLGRQHSAAEAIKAVELARRTFPRLSFDLIYALPDQTLQDWQQDLTQALDLAADHLSLYQLTIEANTGFAGQVARGVFTPMPDDQQARLFDLTQEMTAAAGLPAYEISNHARPGAESRHNLVYWRYGSYIGIGPGAHGRAVIDGDYQARAQWRKPEVWMEAVARDGHGSESIERLSVQSQAEEFLMMGLRLVEGISLERLARILGLTGRPIFDPEKLNRLMAGGFLVEQNDRLVATAQGRAVLNTLLADVCDALVCG